METKIYPVNGNNYFASISPILPMEQDAELSAAMPAVCDSQEWGQTLEALRSHDLCQFYQDLREMIEQEKWPEVLAKLDIVLEEHIPLINDLLKTAVVAGKVNCYEQMQNYEQAVAEFEKILGFWEKHKSLLEHSILAERVSEVSHALALYQGGLLLLAGKKQDAIEVLRNNQPTATSGSTAEALFYRMMEKKLNTTLLIPQEVTDENDLKQLFFAQRYEEVIQKARQTPNFPYDSLDGCDECCGAYEEGLDSCYISALGMLGRFDEIFTADGELCDEQKFLEPVFNQTFNGSCLRVLAGLDSDLPDHITDQLQLRPLMKWFAQD